MAMQSRATASLRTVGPDRTTAAHEVTTAATEDLSTTGTAAARRLEILEVAGSGAVGSLRMGAVSTDICALANEFVRSQHAVTVADARGSQPRPALEGAVRLVELPVAPMERMSGRGGARIGQALRRWRWEWRFLRALRRAVDLGRFDIVHLHDWRLAWLYGYFVRGPYVYTAHTPLWCQPHIGWRAHLQRLLTSGETGERTVIRRAAASIALGSYLGTRLPRARVQVIPNGVDLSLWQPVDRLAARQALGIGPESFVIAFLGRLDPIKGVEVLIEAVRRLAQDGIPTLALLIGPLDGAIAGTAGIGPYANRLMQQAQGLPVWFTGYLSAHDGRLQQHLSAADIAVLPSRFEAQGKALLEAMALNVPVIGAAVGGIPEQLTAAVGHTFPPGDVNALTALLRRLATDRLALAAQRACCRAHVQTHYTWALSARRHLALFAELVE